MSSDPIIPPIATQGNYQPATAGSAHAPVPLRSAMKHTSNDGQSRATSPVLIHPSPRILSPNDSTASSLFSRSPTNTPPPPIIHPSFAIGNHRGSPPPGPLPLSRDSSFASLNTIASPTSASTARSPYSGANAFISDSPVPSPPSDDQKSPSLYTPKVSFSTLENPVASMFSFTLAASSPSYRRTRSTRVFLCAASDDESGKEALDWSLESLVQDGDELIVCRGVDEDELERPHAIVHSDARSFFRIIQAKALSADPTRQLSLILEYVPGKITTTLDRLIALYRPDSVVVGTRGRSKWAGLGIGGGGSVGSVSKYCLTHSPVPIIVVRPERKVRKAIEKRKADPKRGRHFDE